MSGVGAKKQPLLELRWRGELSDYVTAIAWSPNGEILAASSAAGEVMLQVLATGVQQSLQGMGQQSVDCLAFSRDGQFLAAGGQDGKVTIWRVQAEQSECIATLSNAPAWIDHLAWSPTRNQLAFSLGKYVQVWDADLGDVVTTLNFDHSSVLDIIWNPDGKRLTVSGYQGVKIWMAQNWDEDPYLLTIPSASTAIAWSPNSQYIAVGNLDRTIMVMEWENPSPWVMRGFPGKIRQLAWSNVASKLGAPLLASASAESVVIWEKHTDEAIGWEGRVLGSHEGTIQALCFQPNSTLLATAADDGWVGLWRKATQLAQLLDGATNGWACLAWQPQGHQLAAGGKRGEWVLWSQAMRGQGFGRR